MTNLFRFGLVLQHRNMDGDVECAFLSADSIEANVENAEVHVERGAEQLQRAAYYQVSSRYTRWYGQVYQVSIRYT